MFAKFIPKNIQQKLRAKERALDWQVSNSVLDSKLDGDIRPQDIASRSIFVRMCSNKSDVPNILISGGEVGPDGEVQFGGNAYKDYSGGDKVRPIAGIKDIQVEYKGGYKALREATITLRANSDYQFKLIDTLYCRIGYTMFLEWGNSVYYNNNDNYVSNPASEGVTSLIPLFLSCDFNPIFLTIIFEFTDKYLFNQFLGCIFLANSWAKFTLSVVDK